MISINARNARRRCDKYERKFLEKGKKKKKKKRYYRDFFLNFTGTQIGETTTCVIIIEERRIGETRVV